MGPVCPHLTEQLWPLSDSPLYQIRTSTGGGIRGGQRCQTRTGCGLKRKISHPGGGGSRSGEPFLWTTQVRAPTEMFWGELTRLRACVSGSVSSPPLAAAASCVLWVGFLACLDPDWSCPHVFVSLRFARRLGRF